MIFNNLIELIYHSSSVLSNEFCDLLIDIMGENTELVLPDGEISNHTENLFKIRVQ